jgi:hypothetical protein
MEANATANASDAEEKERKKEEAPRRKKEQEEHARQRKKEQEEQARQRTKDQAEQAPNARGKYKTFDDRMEDLKRFKETHGHANVSIPDDKSLAQFCNKARYAHNNPGKGKGKGKGVKLTDERTAAFDALGFNWVSHVTRSFDERIKDLVEYKQTHGHLSVKKHEDNSLYQFCADIRYSLKKSEKDGTRKLTKERMVRLDALGFEW